MKEKYKKAIYGVPASKPFHPSPTGGNEERPGLVESDMCKEELPDEDAGSPLRVGSCIGVYWATWRSVFGVHELHDALYL